MNARPAQEARLHDAHRLLWRARRHLVTVSGAPGTRDALVLLELASSACDAELLLLVEARMLTPTRAGLAPAEVPR